MKQTDDHDVMRACQAGDREAFNQLVGAHYNAVSAYVASRCQHWGLLEEIVQETFVRAWEHCQRFEFNSSTRTWLIGISRNVYREQMRSTRQHSHIAELDALFADDHGELDADERAADLVGVEVAAMQQCMAKLSDRNQKLLLARYHDGRSIKELAISFKKKTQALARHLQRLASGLRECIKEQHQ